VEAAKEVFNDVCGRCFLADLLVNDTSGRTAMMTGHFGQRVDFGAECKEKVGALTAAVEASG
jgi:hypothetical protein